MMAMEYEAGKVEQGALDHLPELTRVKKEVNNWFEENSRKVIDQGRIRDALDSEKTRIYHHELLFKTVEKDKILKLQLEDICLGVCLNTSTTTTFTDEQLKNKIRLNLSQA